jgi:hypothetical protein
VRLGGVARCHPFSAGDVSVLSLQATAVQHVQEAHLDWSGGGPTDWLSSGCLAKKLYQACSAGELTCG